MLGALQRHPVLGFALLALALGWTAALCGMPEWIIGTSPLAAAILCQWHVDGWASIGPFLRRCFTPKLNRATFLLALVAPLGILALAILIGAARLGSWPQWRESVPAVPGGWAALLLAVAWNGPGEEPGWRGFALPRLLARHSPWRATLLVAAVWIPWHYPVLYARGDFTATLVPAFSVALLFGAIWLTAIYRLGEGSVFACIVWHATWNVAATLGRSLEPSVFPWMGAMVALLAIGLLVWQWRDFEHRPMPAHTADRSNSGK